MEEGPQDLMECGFSTEAAFRGYLFRLRWPDGFCCPHCGGRKGWPKSSVSLLCSSCDYQSSVTAGPSSQNTQGQPKYASNSSLEDGHLTHGGSYSSGRFGRQGMISCHACHPSLSNDNVSGLSVWTVLAFSGRDLRYSGSAQKFDEPQAGAGWWWRVFGYTGGLRDDDLTKLLGWPGYGVPARNR